MFSGRGCNRQERPEKDLRVGTTHHRRMAGGCSTESRVRKAYPLRCLSAACWLIEELYRQAGHVDQYKPPGWIALSHSWFCCTPPSLFGIFSPSGNFEALIFTPRSPRSFLPISTLSCLFPFSPVPCLPANERGCLSATS